MFIHRTQNEGERRTNNGHGESRKDPFAAIARLDIPDAVRKHPLPAVVIAGGAGALIGLTVGSRLVRIIIGSVGMYTLSEVLRRYATQAIDDLQRTADAAAGPQAPRPH